MRGTTSAHGGMRPFLLVVIACSFAGVAHSGRGVWTTGGPRGGHVNALAIDPVTPATLYAGTYEGVFKSTDAGGTWTAASIGMADKSVLDLGLRSDEPHVRPRRVPDDGEALLPHPARTVDHVPAALDARIEARGQVLDRDVEQPLRRQPGVPRGSIDALRALGECLHSPAERDMG